MSHNIVVDLFKSCLLSTVIIWPLKKAQGFLCFSLVKRTLPVNTTD